MSAQHTATCAGCKHAAWERTPTGRIRRGRPGRCMKDDDLKAMYLVVKPPPCLSVGRIGINLVWPDYDASGCPLWAVSPKGKA